MSNHNKFILEKRNYIICNIQIYRQVSCIPLVEQQRNYTFISINKKPKGNLKVVICARLNKFVSLSGGALAFNHLAKLLREHTSLVDRFYLELFYYMVVNLSLPGDCHNHPASLALDHLLKVIQNHADLFNKVHHRIIFNILTIVFYYGTQVLKITEL